MKIFESNIPSTRYGYAMLLIGVIAGTAWLTLATDDLIGYWVIPRAVLEYGAYPGVPFSESFIQAGGSKQIFRLPVLGILYGMSTFLFGTTTTALYFPIVLGATLLPLSLFWGFRMWNLSEENAAMMTLLIYLFPPFQLFVAGAAEPDPLFIVLLSTLFGLYGGLITSSDSRLMILFGIVSFFAILTRPEGVGYTGILILGLLYFRMRTSYLAIIPAVSGLLVWAGISYHTIGDIWLTGYTSEAYSISHIIINLHNLASAFSHPNYATFALLVILFGGLLVSIMGMASYYRNKLSLSTIEGIAPIIAGASANLLVIFLLSPTITESDHIGTLYQFFRHTGSSLLALVFASAILLDRLNLNQAFPVKSFGYGLVHIWIASLALPTRFAPQARIIMTHFGIILVKPFPLLSPEFKDVGYLLVDMGRYYTWREQLFNFYPINMFTPILTDSVGGLMKTVSIILILLVLHWHLDPFGLKSILHERFGIWGNENKQG